MTMRQDEQAQGSEAGFSLVEAVVSIGVLTVGVLGLAQVFTLGMFHMATSSSNLVAREKAREAIESVHTARDTRTLTWDSITNVAPSACVGPQVGDAGGIFLNGFQPLRQAGVDGLVSTADDAAADIEASPGPDNVFGNADDTPLVGFERQIEICTINPQLKEIRVAIRYAVGPQQRTYRITTYVSRFS